MQANEMAFSWLYLQKNIGGILHTILGVLKRKTAPEEKSIWILLQVGEFLWVLCPVGSDVLEVIKERSHHSLQISLEDVNTQF